MGVGWKVQAQGREGARFARVGIFALFGFPLVPFVSRSFPLAGGLRLDHRRWPLTNHKEGKKDCTPKSPIQPTSGSPRAVEGSRFAGTEGFLVVLVLAGKEEKK